MLQRVLYQHRDQGTGEEANWQAVVADTERAEVWRHGMGDRRDGQDDDVRRTEGGAEASDGYLTIREHHVRAALLRMSYIPRRGYYVKLGVPIELRLDALTLEPISEEEFKYRCSRGLIGKSWYPHREEQ